MVWGIQNVIFSLTDKIVGGDYKMTMAQLKGKQHFDRNGCSVRLAEKTVLPCCHAILIDGQILIFQASTEQHQFFFLKNVSTKHER